VVSFRSSRGDILLLVVITIILSSMGGTPYYHPDSIIVRSMHVLAHGGDPDFFRYPGLVIYADAFIYGIVYVILSLFHTVAGMDDFQRYFSSGTLPGGIPFHLPALLLTYAFSALGVALTYLLTFDLARERFVAIAASLFVATSLLWGVESHFTTVDMPMSTLVLLTVYVTMRFTRNVPLLSRAQLVTLGLLIGLSTSAKYNAVLVAVPVLAAASTCFQDRARRQSAFLLIALATSLAFLITNPYAFVKPAAFLHQSFDEAAHGIRGHFGWQHDQGYLHHLQTSLLHAVGMPILGLAAIGFYALWRSDAVPLPAKRAVLLFPIVYYSIVGGSKLAFERYMLPLIPFVGILAAWALHEMVGAVRSRSRREGMLRAALLVVAGLVALPNLLHLLAHNRLLAGPDTRKGLHALFANSSTLPARSIFGGHYVETALPVPVDERWESLKRKLPDILALDSFSHDRFMYDRFKSHEFPIRKEDYANARVLQFSPFRVRKAQVPFSPQSVYSPYLPDLLWRRAAGPYVELYVREDSLAAELQTRAREVGAACTSTDARSGYYFQNFEDPRRGDRGRSR
jgi:hypothetical protein